MQKEKNKKFIKISFAVFAMSFFVGQNVMAAPSITSAVPVTTFAHGNVVNISGSGFGTHADYGDTGGLMFAWNNFETGTTTGDGFSQHNDSDDANTWDIMNSGSHGGSYWAKRFCNYPTGADNIGGLFKPNQNQILTNSTQIFMSLWLKIPQGVTSGKFLRNGPIGEGYSLYIGGDDGNTIRSGYDNNCNGGNQGDCPNPGSGTLCYGGSDQVATNTWTRVDLLLDSATDKQTIWQIGAPGQGSDHHQFYTQCNIPTDQYYAILGAGKDSPLDLNNNYYGYDDFYVDFTQMKIELKMI